MNRSLAFGLAAAALLGSSAVAQDDIQELANRWTAAYNNHDAAALGALYAEDAKLFLHGQPSFVGREAIQDYWATDMQEQNPLTVLTVTNSVDGFDMKLVHGDYQVIDRDSGVPLGAGRFAHIWMLADDGGWLLDRDLWNQPVEPSTPAE
jgi:uncharacterized protein (TIGR02246 family)